MRPIDFGTTQLKCQGPSRTFEKSKEEEKKIARVIQLRSKFSEKPQSICCDKLDADPGPRLNNRVHTAQFRSSRAVSFRSRPPNPTHPTLNPAP